MEQNFKDIIVKIEKVEQNFEDIRSNVQVEKNINTIINKIKNIEKSLCIKNENKGPLFEPQNTTNNIQSNIELKGNNESLERRLVAIENMTANLKTIILEEINKKNEITNTYTVNDASKSHEIKIVNNIDIKLAFENLENKIKKINIKKKRKEQIEINTEKILSILKLKIGSPLESLGSKNGEKGEKGDKGDKGDKGGKGDKGDKGDKKAPEISFKYRPPAP
jgi:hypothetical protein